MALIEVEFSNALLRKESQAERDKVIADLKGLLKVGLAVNVENGLHEVLRKAVVVEVGDDTFKLQHGGRCTVTKFENAWFVKNGRKKLTLGDNDHCYSHVI